MLLTKEFLSHSLIELSYIIIDDAGFLDCSIDTAISIDSRTIKPGEIFLAIKGDKVDGHDFVKQVIKKGAIGIIISNKESLKNFSEKEKSSIFIIHVEDTVEALISIAKSWRHEFNIPIIGVTGSVGKTLTKDLIGHVLKKNGFNPYISFGNQNTIIGVSLNILKLNKLHDVGVFELGINEKGEMAQLSYVLRPTFAVITKITHSHSQGLGSLGNITREKKDIFKFFSGENIGVIPGDQEHLTGSCFSFPIVRFGFKTKNQVQARKIFFQNDINGKINTSFVLKWYGEKQNVVLEGNHCGYLESVLASSALCYLFKISLKNIILAINTFKGSSGRFERKKNLKGNGEFISDCYNANPESMKAAIQAFDGIPNDKSKVAIIGDMLELGEKEYYWHRQIGRYLQKTKNIKKIILVGSKAKMVSQTTPSSIKIEYAQCWREAIDILQRFIAKEELFVLVKGSNGVKLSNLVNFFTESQ